MAVQLMTTTGTEADVRAALGLKPVEGQSQAPTDALISATAEPADTSEKPAEAVPEVVADAPAPPVDTDDDDATPQGKGAQTRGRLQKRIDELVAARYHTQGELDAAKRQIDKLEAQLSQKPAEAPSAPAAPSGDAPREADFDTYDAYLAAVARHAAHEEVESRLKAQKADDDTKRQQTEQERVRATLHDRITAFAADHPDYEDTISNKELPNLTPVMLEVLMDPENDLGPALAYALAKDPARFKAVAAMPPIKAIKEFGRLEHEVRGNGAKASAPPMKTPAAPPPPTPVRGTSASATLSLEELAKRITPGDSETSVWLARRNAELAKRGSR